MAKNKTIKPETLEAAPVVRAEKKVDKKAEPKAKAKKVKAEKQPKKNAIKETFGELKKVTWPSFGKTMAQTGMVIATVAIFAAFVFGVDLLLGWLFGLISG